MPSFHPLSAAPVSALESAAPIFPVVAASSHGSDSSGTQHAITLPSGIAAGDLLLVGFANDGGATVSVGAGSDWTQLFSTADGAVCRLSVYYKIAAGSDTLRLDTSASEASAYWAYRITGHDAATAPAVGTAATDASVNPDPPSLNPSGWDVENTLWIATYGWDGNASSVSYPIGYEDNQITDGGSTGSTDCGIAAATKENAAASEDPATGQIGFSDDWIANTIAIRPAQPEVEPELKNLTATVEAEIGNQLNLTFAPIELTATVDAVVGASLSLDQTIALTATAEATVNASVDSLGESLKSLTATSEAVIVGETALEQTISLTATAEAVTGASLYLSQTLSLTATAEASFRAAITRLVLEDDMLDYDSSANGFFKHVGKCVKHYNLQRTDGRDLNSDLLDVIEVFQAGDKDLIVDGMPSEVEGWKNEHVSRREFLVGLVNSRFQHREDVLEEIGATTEDFQEIFRKFHHRMIIDGETIKRCTVSIGGVTAGSSNSANTGTGRVLVTTLLDGVTSPGVYPGGQMLSCSDYRRVRSELAVTAETMLLICTTDVASDGIDAGTESFRWTGGPAHELHGMEDNQGSGDIAEFQVANAARLLLNLDLEDETTANIPDNFTVAAGTAGTSFTLSSSAGEFHHGTQGLKFISGQAGGTLTQAIQGIGSTVVGNKSYLLACWCKASAAATTGRVRLKFSGTGYSAATGTVQVQRIELTGTPDGGPFTITLLGQTTGAIAFDAAAVDVEAALRLLPGLECVTVARSGSAPNYIYDISMHNVPGNRPVLSVDDGLLTGTTPGITCSIETAGVESEEIDLTGAALPTEWALLHCWITTPDTLPSDFKLSLQVTSPDVDIFVDDLVIDEVRYGGGIGCHVVRGTTPFVRDDRFTFEVANDNAGVLQRFLREAYGVQFPSSASNTIDDSLAI